MTLTTSIFDQKDCLVPDLTVLSDSYIHDACCTFCIHMYSCMYIRTSTDACTHTHVDAMHACMHTHLEIRISDIKMPGVIKVGILKNNFQHSNNISVITGYTTWAFVSLTIINLLIDYWTSLVPRILPAFTMVSTRLVHAGRILGARLVCCECRKDPEDEASAL